MGLNFDAIVLGAGAAGLMCAATAGRRGLRVALVDHTVRLAEKIRISGGGRCNFTNLDVRPEAYLSRDPDFCRAALEGYGPQDFIRLARRHRIAFHEKSLGQLFCDRSATDIIEMLQRECDGAGVSWVRPVDIQGVERTGDDRMSRFVVRTTGGTLSTASLVVATGGLAVPQVGATPLGYKLAEQFGQAIVPPKPGLVPLAAEPEWRTRFGALAGASFECAAQAEAGPAFREAALITHRGLSGPAILQASSYWQWAGGKGWLSMNLLPGEDAARWLAHNAHSRVLPATLLARRLPRRLAQCLAESHGWTRPLSELDATERARMASVLGDWRYRPSGTLGYAKAEVTLGGVDTGGLHPRTMESRTVPGLYFIGEVVDVTGWLGGYNFQWAWSSAVAAARALDRAGS